VGCIATGGGWPGAVNTLGALRDIVACIARLAHAPRRPRSIRSERVFDDDGQCVVPRVSQMLDLIAAEVLGF